MLALETSAATAGAAAGVGSGAGADGPRAPAAEKKLRSIICRFGILLDRSFRTRTKMTQLPSQHGSLPSLRPRPLRMSLFRSSMALALSRPHAAEK